MGTRMMLVQFSLHGSCHEEKAASEGALTNPSERPVNSMGHFVSRHAPPAGLHAPVAIRWQEPSTRP